MSNQPTTDLQRREETKESFIEKTAKDTLSKTLSILIAGGILAVISAIIALIAGLPYYLYIPLGALVFCLVSFGWFLFQFIPTHRRLNEEVEFLKAEVESLKNAKPESSSLESEEKLQLANTNPETNLEIKKTRAEIKGEITSCWFTQPSSLCYFRVRVHLYNVGEQTSLVSFGFRVSRPNETKTWDRYKVVKNVGEKGETIEEFDDGLPNLYELLNQKPPYEFRSGIHTDGWLIFRVAGMDRTYYEFYQPTLIIKDGFGDTHEITNETLAVHRREKERGG